MAFDIEPPDDTTPSPGALDGRMAAMAALYRAVVSELASHPGAPYLAPDRTLGASSIGKAYMRAIGVSSPLKRTPRESRRAIGAATSAYVGPRSEVRLRRVTVPVAYIDAHSMFLTIDVLMGLSELLTHRVEVRRYRTKRDLAALAERLGGMSLDALLARPELWPLLRGVALVTPDWDWLPTKAPYTASGEETTTVSYVASSAEPMWVPFASLVESMLRTGRLPPIIEAYEWVPAERLPGLGRVRVGRDGPLIDLSGRPAPGAFTDPFLALAAERARLKADTALTAATRGRMRGLLKVMALSIGYGAEIEFNRRGKARELTVWGPAGRTEATVRPEHPGWLCYPPFATACVAGSRLMMGLLERLVADAGGDIVWIDTDGGCVVVTPDGGLIPCPGGAYLDPEGRECVKALSLAELQADQGDGSPRSPRPPGSSDRTPRGSCRCSSWRTTTTGRTVGSTGASSATRCRSRTTSCTVVTRTAIPCAIPVRSSPPMPWGTSCPP